MALPIFAELVLDGVEAAGAGAIVSGIYKHFEQPVKKMVVDEAGKLVGEYAKNNPAGVVDMALESANQHRMSRNSRKVRRTCR